MWSFNRGGHFASEHGVPGRILGVAESDPSRKQALRLTDKLTQKQK
jgi:hypothetical protein